MELQSKTSKRKPAPGIRIAITGGTSGLGHALVREWRARGATVAFVARGTEGIRHVAGELPGTFGIAGDVSRKDDIYPMATQILGALGGLDVLVNNASSLGPVPLALLGDTACEEFETALLTNLLGPFRLTKALLGALAASARDGRGGVVMNIVSDAAVTAYPNWGAYGASKAALAQMSRIWHEELRAEGVRVLTIDPGDMDTPLHARALPDADPATLLRPAEAATRVADVIAAELAAAPHSRPLRAPLSAVPG
jgi:NAD(P)-dependent dehydrogenase (short-subunit alcohol dehydrogenase family)